MQQSLKGLEVGLELRSAEESERISSYKTVDAVKSNMRSVLVGLSGRTSSFRLACPQKQQVLEPGPAPAGGAATAPCPRAVTPGRASASCPWNLRVLDLPECGLCQVSTPSALPAWQVAMPRVLHGPSSLSDGVPAP